MSDTATTKHHGEALDTTAQENLRAALKREKVEAIATRARTSIATVRRAANGARVLRSAADAIVRAITPSVAA